MKLYLDTSSLIKLYYKETDADHIDELFSKYPIEELFLSLITITEFYSAVYKKVRTKDVSLQNANDIINSFDADIKKFTFIAIDTEIISTSQILLRRYGILGLRSLDAIQFACAYINRAVIDYVVSSDVLLNSFLMLENIKTL